MAGSEGKSIVPIQRIAERIWVLRGQKAMLDFDLAELYGVQTRMLNQAVTRNAARFPEDFMFRLTSAETEAVNRSQIVTGSQKHRGPHFPPRAFTQEGVAMLSGVLRSKQIWSAPKLPRPTGREMVRFLEAQGFAVVRIRGSHHVLHRGVHHTTAPCTGTRRCESVLCGAFCGT